MSFQTTLTTYKIVNTLQGVSDSSYKTTYNSCRQAAASSVSGLFEKAGQIGGSRKQKQVQEPFSPL